MFRKLRNRWNRDKLRKAELQALLDESEKTLEISYRDHADDLGEIHRLNAKVRTLSSQVVDATNMGIKFEEKSSHFEKLNGNQARRLLENNDLIIELRSSLRDYVRVNNDLTSEGVRTLAQMTKAESEAAYYLRSYNDLAVMLDQEQRRIVLAVAALTRDLPAKTTSVAE